MYCLIYILRARGSRCVSLIYHYTHYTYTQLPRFQHHSLCVYAESREYTLTNYSYYVTQKQKRPPP